MSKMFRNSLLKMMREMCCKMENQVDVTVDTNRRCSREVADERQPAITELRSIHIECCLDAREHLAQHGVFRTHLEQSAPFGSVFGLLANARAPRTLVGRHLAKDVRNSVGGEKLVCKIDGWRVVELAGTASAAVGQVDR